MKSNHTYKLVKEISEQPDLGFRAFIHKSTRQLLFVPDEHALPGIDLTAWEKELKLLENNFTDYFEIEKWTSGESYEIMADFAMEICKDKRLQSQLLDSLEKKIPFREFKFVIDISGEYRQQWLDFKNERQQAIVARKFNRMN